jgi:serine phosphatase RsbU (regulator of sigma subunit)
MRDPVAGEKPVAASGGESPRQAPSAFAAVNDDAGEPIAARPFSIAPDPTPSAPGSFATRLVSVPQENGIPGGDGLSAPLVPSSSPLAGPKSSSSAERLHFLEALVRASNAISSTLDPARVAEILVARASEILAVPAVSLMLLDEKGGVRVTAAKGLSPSYIQAQAGPLEQSIAGRALAEERTFAAWDIRQSADPKLAGAAEQEGIISVACAPMFFGGKPVGALNVYCRDTRCFTEDQFHVLSLLAAQGAIALTNARAYREIRSQAAEVRAGFQRVGAALSASLDIGETLRLIVQLASEMTGADAGAMFMLQNEEEGGGMRLAGMRGMDRRSVRRFRQMPVSPLARRALDERRVVIVPDTRRMTDTPFPTLRLSMDQTAEARSVVCVPVLVGDRPLGVLEQYTAEPGRFTKSDIQLLSSFAHQASVAIENARLYAQERSIAQTLQRSFLPDVPYSLSGIQIGRIYAPGSEVAAVGGDTYDLFTLPDGRIAVLMADVSGQGTHAATLAVMAKYTIRAYALEDPDPSCVLRRGNEAFRHQTDDSMFLTLCYGLLDPKTRSITIASAAHPPALLCRAGTKDVIPVGGEPGLISGFLPNQEYPSATVPLASGDVLVFYTDGVIEARRRKVMFAADRRLEKTIAANAHLSAQEIASNLYAAVVEYAGGERTDDIALLVLKVD